MRRTGSGVLLVLVHSMGVLLCCVWAQAQISVNTKTETSVLIEPLKAPSRASKAEINWTKGVLVVESKGAPKKGETDIGVMELQAREAAIATAYRDMAAAVSGVHVSSDVTVEDCRLASAVIRTQLDATVKGAALLTNRENWNEQKKIYTVALAMRMHGDEGLLALLAEHREDVIGPLEEKKTPPKPKIIREPEPVVPSGKPYTGLIIDCRGLGVKPAMSPKIIRPDGSEVWGTVRVSSEEVSANGIVGYLTDIESAKKSPRSGDNPLVIRAIGKQGSFTANAVVSGADAALILEGNNKANPKFLESFRVTFVYDSKWQQTMP